MSHVVIQLPKNQLATVQAYYHKNQISKPVPYTQFIAKKNGTTITAYTSGKILFQGGDIALNIEAISKFLKEMLEIKKDFTKLSLIQYF